MPGSLNLKKSTDDGKKSTGSAQSGSLVEVDEHDAADLAAEVDRSSLAVWAEG